jgi:predicted nucleic acid-binding protein
LDATLRPFAAGNRPVVPIVVFGEVKSIAMQNGWGTKKLALLDELLLKVLRADITLEIVERYAEIDAFSQNKLANRPLGNTARNMGKNDLWIAATASVLNTQLLTADPDFDHLDGVFLEVERVVV